MFYQLDIFFSSLIAKDPKYGKGIFLGIFFSPNFIDRFHEIIIIAVNEIGYFEDSSNTPFVIL
jgi:hypothetical protein